MNVPLTPIRFLRYASDQYPDNTAVVCGAQRFTYAQFAERVCRLAGALRGCGIAEGDRVALLSFNCHRLLEAYFGVLEAGAILTPLNVRLAAEELVSILNDCAPAILLFDRTLAATVESFHEDTPAIRNYVLLDGSTDASWLSSQSYDDLLSSAAPYHADLMRIDENSVAELFYTSGVSAHPKGVMLTHRNVYLHAVNAALAFNMTAVDAHLHAIPLFHANSWGAAHVITLMGGKHVMLPSFEPSDALRLMARERVRSCLLDPEMAIALLRAPERHECELSSLKWVAIGGAPSSPTLVREVRERLGCDCFCGYGLTETSPIVAISRRRPGVNWKGEQHYERQAMAGYAIPGVEVRILDENGADAPRDGRTVGEIVVRGDGVMRGYWRQQEAGARALRDGWFHTGDLATIDAHGYISVVDRKEDVIGAGEERISSVKLEETLRAHPCVLEAAVISDETAGRAAKAFVALKPGRRVSEDDILAFCRARLPDHRALQAVEFVSELPKTANGKTPKWKLRGNRVRKRLEHALAAPDLT